MKTHKYAHATFRKFTAIVVLFFLVFTTFMGSNSQNGVFADDTPANDYLPTFQKMTDSPFRLASTPPYTCSAVTLYFTIGEASNSSEVNEALRVKYNEYANAITSIRLETGSERLITEITGDHLDIASSSPTGSWNANTVGSGRVFVMTRSVPQSYPATAYIKVFSRALSSTGSIVPDIPYQITIKANGYNDFIYNTYEDAVPDEIVNVSPINGITPPASLGIPVESITETNQYTGNVEWTPAPTSGCFAYGTEYTATITLTPKEGYTLTGVSENFFTVNGASSVTNAADSGVITAVFPATAAEPGDGLISPPIPTNHGGFTHSNATYASNPRVGLNYATGDAYSAYAEKITAIELSTQFGVNHVLPITRTSNNATNTTEKSYISNSGIQLYSQDFTAETERFGKTFGQYTITIKADGYRDYTVTRGNHLGMGRTDYYVLTKDNITLPNDVTQVGDIYDKSNEFRAVWHEGSPNEGLREYLKTIKSITLDGSELTRNVPLEFSSTQPKPNSTNRNCFYINSISNDFPNMLAVAMNPLYGEHTLVIKSTVYADQTVNFDNGNVSPFFVAPGFDMNLTTAKGLFFAPEGIDDSTRGEDAFLDYYAWNSASTVYGVPNKVYVQEYTKAITSIKAYTDMYPEGIELTKVSSKDIPLPAFKYAYSADGGIRIRTNGVIMDQLGDPRTDKVNRLEIKATGYADYDTGTFAHGTKKFPVALTPAQDIIRSTYEIDPPQGSQDPAGIGYDLNSKPVITFSPNADFESSISEVTVSWPAKGNIVAGSQTLTAGTDFVIDRGTLTIEKSVFLGDNKPVARPYTIDVVATGYFDTSVQQYIGSNDPFDGYSPSPGLVLEFYKKDGTKEIPDVTVSQQDIYAFAAAHNRFNYSDEDGFVYADSGQYSFNSVRRGVQNNSFKGIDLAALVKEKAGIDLYDIAKQGQKDYRFQMIATDGYEGSGASLVSSVYGSTKAYFPHSYSTGYEYHPDLTPIPMPAIMFNLNYDNGTIMLSGLKETDIGKGSRSMIGQGYFHNSVQTNPGHVKFYETDAPAKADAPVLTKVGGRDVTNPSATITANVGDELEFAADSTVFYSIAWDGNTPADPLAKFSSTYRIAGDYGGITQFGKALFNRGGTATVKLMTDGGVDSDVVTYTFNVTKKNRPAPDELSADANTPGAVFGTTQEMEYNGISSDMSTGWIEATDLYTVVANTSANQTWYFRYKEDDNYYASPAAAVTVAKSTKTAQDAPVGLTGNMPASEGADGSISGLAVGMQIKSKSADDWTDYTAGSDAYAPGDYYVRYAETKAVGTDPGKQASPPVKVTVQKYRANYAGVLFEVLDYRGGKATPTRYSVTQAVATAASEAKNYNYSTVNRYGTFKLYNNVNGPKIETLFTNLGITGIAPNTPIEANTSVEFIASDGYMSSVRWDYLTAARYYYPKGEVTQGQPTGKATQGFDPELNRVPAIIALNNSNGTVMFGQRAPHEQTNDVFTQEMASYKADTNRVGQIVLRDGATGSAAKFPSVPSTTPATGSTVKAGTQITFDGWAALLGYNDGYIYYTLDGSEPTVNSNLYNYNTYNGANGSVYKPKLNGAFAQNGVFTVKVKVIGKNKTDSDTVTFTYNLEGYVAGTPAAPTGLGVEAPTSPEGMGKITGTVADTESAVGMEYRASDAEASEPWTNCAAGNTPVYPGDYDVRYKAKGVSGQAGYVPPSVAAQVTVPDYEPTEAGSVLFTIKEGSRTLKQVTQADFDLLYKSKGVKATYSSYNSWPTKQEPFEDIKGIKVTDLIEDAGFTGAGAKTMVTFTAEDKYTAQITWAQLNEDRFFFDEKGVKGDKVPAIVSITSEHAPRNFIGQLGPLDQTESSFVKKIKTISVTSGGAGTWSKPLSETASGSTVRPTQKIRLKLATADGNGKAGKIYYTTDGSEPTVYSKIYNATSDDWLKPVSQEGTGKTENTPISVPVLANGSQFTVRAKVIGYGKANGAEAKFTYKVENLSGFVGKAGGPWKYYDKYAPVVGWKDITKNGKTGRYHFAADGVMDTGWTTISGKRYYFGGADDGVMTIGWRSIKQGSKTYRYYFASNGVMATGLTKISGKYYYFDTAAKNIGKIKTGWLNIKQGTKTYRYYFASNGVMATGLTKISGKHYYFGTATKDIGRMKTGFQSIKQRGKTYRYYFASNGVMKTGFVKISGKYYYFATDTKNIGRMAKGWQNIKQGGKIYRCHFAANGVMDTGWRSISGKRYYFGTSTKDIGRMKTGWQNIAGKWYYFGSDGKLTNKRR